MNFKYWEHFIMVVSSGHTLCSDGWISQYHNQGGISAVSSKGHLISLSSWQPLRVAVCDRISGYLSHMPSAILLVLYIRTLRQMPDPASINQKSLNPQISLLAKTLWAEEANIYPGYDSILVKLKC